MMAEKPAHEEINQKEMLPKASSAQWQTTFDAIRDSVCLLDMNGKVLRCNKAMESLLKKSSEEIIGSTCWELIHGTDKPIKGCPIVRMKKTLCRETLALEADDKWLNVTVDPVIDETGNLTSVVHIISDITRRKRAEKTFRESEDRLKTTLNSIQAGIVVIDAETHTIVDVNPAAIRMIGATKEQIIGHVCHKYICPAEEGKCPIADLGQKVDNSERILLTANGKEVPVLKTVTTTFLGGKECLLDTFIDITEKKKLESQLAQAQKMEAISALAGGIAHQFNNALFAITGNLNLLEMHFPGNEKLSDYTRKMEDSTRRMTRLTAQLLAYASGGKYHAKTISLSDFVRDTLPLIRHTIDSAISVETDQPPGIFNVKADLTQMQMALSAVLTNAAEAMDGKGQIRIVCRTTMITDETAVDFPELKPGNYISLTITDDGKGMDEETKTRIFEPFFTTKFEGRGLGMAAAYGIVKNHDGWIAVDSELGKGTIVTIYLPAVEALVKEHAKPKTEPIKGRGTILVIEDEKTVMEVTREILETLGYSVLEAKTGQEAINVAKTFDGDIDLVMLDILLPDMSGDDVYPFLMAARPDLKVIVFSGYSVDGPAQKILNAGAQDFIQKPFSVAELSEKLKKALGSEQ